MLLEEPLKAIVPARAGGAFYTMEDCEQLHALSASLIKSGRDPVAMAEREAALESEDLDGAIGCLARGGAVGLAPGAADVEFHHSGAGCIWIGSRVGASQRASAGRSRCSEVRTRRRHPACSRLLYRFNLIVDYNHRRMFVKPNAYFSDAFELNMAGMSLAETPGGETVVYQVIEGSEAARKGMRKGDVVTAVDGQAVNVYDYLELRKIFERDGSTVVVDIVRDGRPETVQLELTRML